MTSNVDGLWQASCRVHCLTSKGFHGALYDPRAGVINPLAYCHGLASAAQENGAHIYTHNSVRNLRRNGLGWQAETEKATINAGSVLLATNAYAQDLTAPVQMPHSVLSYCQFATEPLSAEFCHSILTQGKGCWDTALIISYFRLDAEGHLIVGGVGNTDGWGTPIHQSWA